MDDNDQKCLEREIFERMSKMAVQGRDDNGSDAI